MLVHSIFIAIHNHQPHQQLPLNPFFHHHIAHHHHPHQLISEEPQLVHWKFIHLPQLRSFIQAHHQLHQLHHLLSRFHQAHHQQAFNAKKQVSHHQLQAFHQLQITIQCSHRGIYVFSLNINHQAHHQPHQQFHPQPHHHTINKSAYHHPPLDILDIQAA